MGKKDSKCDAPKAEENVERPGRAELCRWPGDAEQRVDVDQPDDGGGGVLLIDLQQLARVCNAHTLHRINPSH